MLLNLPYLFDPEIKAEKRAASPIIGNHGWAERGLLGFS
jgi:hypothetical protein